MSGLSGPLVLQDNNGDNLTVTANGAFGFVTPIASEQAYKVTVKTQPGSPTQSCVVSSGSGTITISTPRGAMLPAAGRAEAGSLSVSSAGQPPPAETR